MTPPPSSASIWPLSARAIAWTRTASLIFSFRANRRNHLVLKILGRLACDSTTDSMVLGTTLQRYWRAAFLCPFLCPRYLKISRNSSHLRSVCGGDESRRESV